jgi:hypothetical protein
MRTKDVNNGINVSNDNLEEPQGLSEFMDSLAEQFHNFEENSGTRLAVNISVRVVENGEEHFIPLSYVRNTKPLCGASREGGFCAAHAESDVPQFLNVLDVSGPINVYHPYDSDHLRLMHETNTGYLGDPAVDAEPIDEFKVVFGEIMLKNTPIPDNSLLRTAAGKIKFWGGKLQDAAKNAKNAVAGNPLLSLLRSLGINPDKDSSGSKDISEEQANALSIAIAQALGPDAGEVIDPNDPEEFAKLPPELQEMVKATGGTMSQMRLVRMNRSQLGLDDDDSNGVQLAEPVANKPTPISDLDVSMISDPTKLIKASKTVH